MFVFLYLLLLLIILTEICFHLLILPIFTPLKAQIYTTFLYLSEDDSYFLFLGYIREKIVFFLIAVVTHMGLHSHRVLRVSTLTLILMAVVAFSRLRQHVQNPKRQEVQQNQNLLMSRCQIPQHTFWGAAESMLQWIRSDTAANVDLNVTSHECR